MADRVPSSSVIRITMTKTIHRYPYSLHGQNFTEETNTKYLKVTIADNMTNVLKRPLKINNPDIKSCAYQLSSTAAWIGIHTLLNLHCI